MAEGSGSGAGDKKMISINIKTPKEQKVVQVPEDGTVKEVSISDKQLLEMQAIGIWQWNSK